MLILGTAIGLQLHPFARTPHGQMAITLGCCLIWLTDTLVQDSTAVRLIDVTTVVVNTVALWPDDPQNRVRKALQRLQTRLKLFSTGMPVHSA